MKIQSLGYLGIESHDPNKWVRFGTEILGMQAVGDSDGAVQLRMDERHHRITVERGSAEGGAWYGWEVADAAELDAAAAELEAAGVAVKTATCAELERRRVAGMVWCEDPAGHRVELFHGAAPGDGEFVASRDISGFVTGTLGLGHVVLMVPEIDAARAFYLDLLGFRLSDYMTAPFNAAFLHTNPRHHSLALLATGVSALHHFMVELVDLDDLGRTYDLVQRESVPVAATLGRHTNDQMVSFYAQTPSGFQVEYGWGGLLIDDETWTATELLAGPSRWGHAGIG